MPLPDAAGRFEDILRFAADRQISDVHVKVGQRPLYRRGGNLITRREEAAFNEGELAEIAQSLFSPNHAKAFNAGAEVTCGHGVTGAGRFRVHVYRQRQSIALSVRVLQARVGTFRELRLPPALGGFCGAQSGLVLVCGGQGAGRSTTLAALVEIINTASHAARHVVTLERPIEVHLEDKLAWICQREVGVDTPSFAEGLRGAMAQDTDVIAVGEVGNAEVMDLVLSAAEAGALVIAAVRATDIAQAIRRLTAMYGADRVRSFRERLAGTLVGATSQRLVPGKDGQTRLAAVEVLVANERAYQVIYTGTDPAALYDIMHSRAQGMQTADLSLVEMLRADAITLEVAVRHASRVEELHRMRQRESSHPDSGLF